MDYILEFTDSLFMDSFYNNTTQWPRDSIYRQLSSLWFIAGFGGILLYLSTAMVSYIFLFDKDTMKHPKFLKNQIAKEIWVGVTSIPVMAAITAPIFTAEVRGYSQLYENLYGPLNGGLALAGEFLWFLLFTDCLVYWIHRWLHHPKLYFIHKPHHRWVLPSPFASHAFHPLDGFLQGVPYHIFVFLFPMHKGMYIFMFIFVNLWTVSIHDGNYQVGGAIVNSCAHHTDHHLFFNFNYGQYFTLWDRIGGSYRTPYVHTNPGELLRAVKEGKQQASGSQATASGVSSAMSSRRTRRQTARS